MREIKPTVKKCKHKVFVNGSPSLAQIPKKEFGYLIAALELEIIEYYKEKNGDKSDARPP